MNYLSHMLTKTKCNWLDLAHGSQKENAELLRYASFALFERYEDFDAIIEEYKVCPNPSRVVLTAPVLREFYVKPPIELGKNLSDRRSKHKLHECPYCGHPFPPGTLDHFMPKEDWPEFAIFSNNLVPQCRGCAPIKGQRYYCKIRGQALFLHPMYSFALSTVRFNIEVSLVEEKPLFKPKFSISDEVSEEDATRIKLHLKSLKVPQRIVDYCESQYLRWIRLIRAKACNIKVSFETRMNERECDPYPNNWGTAFYQGVLSNPDVLAHIQGKGIHRPSRSSVKIRALPMED